MLCVQLQCECFSLLHTLFLFSQSLMWLDVSRNGLESVKLGNRPQMANLVTLALSGNNIVTLGKDDFFYLQNSSLQVLKLLKMTNLRKVRQKVVAYFLCSFVLNKTPEGLY